MNCHRHKSEVGRYLSHFPEDPKISCESCYRNAKRRQNYTHLSQATKKLKDLLGSINLINSLRRCLDDCTMKTSAIMQEAAKCNQFINAYEAFITDLQGPQGLLTFIQSGKELPRIMKNLEHFNNLQREALKLAMSIHSQQNIIIEIYNMSNIQNGLQEPLVGPTTVPSSFPLFCQCPSTLILRQEYIRLVRLLNIYKPILKTPEAEWKRQLNIVYEGMSQSHNIPQQSEQLLRTVRESQNQRLKQLQILNKSKDEQISILTQQVTNQMQKIEQLSSKLFDLQRKTENQRTQIERGSLLFNSSIIIQRISMQSSMSELLRLSKVPIQQAQLIKRIENVNEHKQWIDTLRINEQYQAVVLVIWLKDDNQILVFVTKMTLVQRVKKGICSNQNEERSFLTPSKPFSSFVMDSTRIHTANPLTMQTTVSKDKILVGKELEISIQAEMELKYLQSSRISSWKGMPKKKVRMYEVFGIVI